MRKQKSLDKKVEDLCDKHGVVEPLEFLTQVAAGQDPRYVSDLYDKIKAIEHEYGDELPDDWDWLEIKEIIKERYKHFVVPLAESHKAMNQILEYTHAKKKQVDHTGRIDTTKQVQPLSRKEIRVFTKKFNHEY